MTPGHAGVQLVPITAVYFGMLQFRIFRMLGVTEYTALYGRNPDIRYIRMCRMYGWACLRDDRKAGRLPLRPHLHIIFCFVFAVA